MPDLVLGGNGLRTMEGATLERALALLDAARRRDLRLHDDWSRPALAPALLAASLARRLLRPLVMCAPEHPLEALTPLWEEGGCGLCLVVPADLRCRLPEPPPARRFELFVALSRPDLDLAWLQPWLGAGGVTRVRLGVGWVDALSGPLPMRAGDTAAWAKAVERAVEQVSRTGVETELACGVPLCLLSREALGRLAVQRVLWPIATCPASLLIHPDGSLDPCPRLRWEPRLQVERLGALGAAEQVFEAWLGPFRGICLKADRPACRSLRTQACGTGCLEHDLGGWRRNADARPD